MIGILVLVFSSLVFGRIVLRLLRITPCNRSEAVLHALGLGLGVWCLLLFTLGHCHLLYRGLLIAASSAAALFSLAVEIRAVVSRRPGVRLLPPMSRPSMVLIVVTGIMAVLALICCYAPVTGGIGNDEICTHLTIPREWLLRHGFDILPWAISYQAGNAHLLFLLTSCFEAQAGPRAVSWLSYVLCIAAVYRLARGFLNRDSSMIAVVITALNPLVFRGASVAMVDLESSLFVILPLCALGAWKRDRSTGWLIAAAAYMAIGIGIKPTNIVYSLVIIAVTGGTWVLQRRGIGHALARTAFLALVTAVIASPWPLRNLLLTGSPTFPPPLALYDLGDVKPLLNVPRPYDRDEILGYNDYCLSRYGDYRRTPINLLRLPWDVTMKPERFQIGDSIGALMLSLLPLLLLLMPLPGTVWFLLVFSGSSCALLYFGVLPEARYYIGLLMALAPALAYSFSQVEKKGRVSSFALRAVLCLNVVFCLLIGVRISKTPLMAVLYPSRAEEQRRARIPYFETFEFIRSRGIGTVRVCYASQLFYYMSARFIVDPAACLAAASPSDSMYILDLDYSQSLERDPAQRNGEYCFNTLTGRARLVYEGPDARLYLREPSAAVPGERQ